MLDGATAVVIGLLENGWSRGSREIMFTEGNEAHGRWKFSA